MPGPHSFVALKRRPRVAMRGRSSWSLGLLVWSVACLCALPVVAQDQAPQKPYVLHVYTNLMQLAALVLDTDDRPLKHLDTSRFAMRLEGGPAFRPAYVRLEGDDPISLSILVDLSADISDLLPVLREAIPALAPDQLHAKDHVSVYALDCKLVRTADDIPANRATLAAAFNQAVNEPELHGRKGKPGACGNSVSLVDALAMVARPLSALPGRRVILVLSNGYDGKSSLRWSQLRQFAAAESISVFGMMYTTSGVQPSGFVDPLARQLGADIDRTPNPLGALCDLTGGVAVFLSSDRKVFTALPHFVDTVRGRYILEFHRPNDAKPGRYTVDVTLDRTFAHIRVGGTSVRVATAAELAKPELAPGDIPSGDTHKTPSEDTPPNAPQ
jgi:VWFA-related protein